MWLSAPPQCVARFRLINARFPAAVFPWSWPRISMGGNHGISGCSAGLQHRNLQAGEAEFKRTSVKGDVNAMSSVGYGRENASTGSGFDIAGELVRIVSQLAQDIERFDSMIRDQRHMLHARRAARSVGVVPAESLLDCRRGAAVPGRSARRRSRRRSADGSPGGIRTQAQLTAQGSGTDSLGYADACRDG
jgi:hypothetical protein